MTSARAEDGRVLITLTSEPDEYTPDEARRLADNLLYAANLAEQQQNAIWALCEVGHDWSPWLNGHQPFRNHYRRCRRPNCVDGYEQYPGWMPFAGRPHADMFGPRQCYGPGCDHCETEQLGSAFSKFLRGAAARMDEYLNDTDEVRP